MPKNEVDSFLDGLDQSPEDPLAPVIEDPLALKEEGEKPVDEEKPEKAIPFHKDPKIQKFIEKEIRKGLESIKPESPASKKEEKDDSADIIDRIIGNDTPEKVAAGKEFRKYLSSLEERGAERALNQLSQQAEQERQAEAEAEEELSSGFESVEDAFGIDLTSNIPATRKLRGEFIDFITRIAPKDKDGEVTEFPDFEETYKLFKDMRKPEPNTRAKELSSRSMGRSSDASTIPKNTGNTWKDVDKIFSNMK